MPGTPPEYPEDYNPAHNFQKQKIIWVGRVTDSVKRIGWIMSAAERLPEYQFEIIGPLEDGSINASDVVEASKSIRNVTFAGKFNRSATV